MPNIVVATHQRAYADRLVTIPGATLTTYDDGTSIANGDVAYVYYDDPARRGSGIVLKATKTLATAVTSGSNPWRHFVGSVTVPAAGGASISGSQANFGGIGGSITTPIP